MSKPDGTACNDGDACTLIDTCQQGVCTGGQPVLCTAIDQCHAAGTCDPTSGSCTNPPKPDGTACDDGNACTFVDTCSAGTCVGQQGEVTIAIDSTVPREIHATRAVISGSVNGPSAIASVTIGGAVAATTSSTGGVKFSGEVALVPGPNLFVVQAADACGDSATQSVSIEFINHPPVWDALQPVTMQEGGHLSMQIAATDQDGDVLTYASTGRPEWLQFDPSTRTVTISPGVGSAGTYAATFTASDGIAAPVPVTMTIVISAIAGSWVGGGVASCASAGNGLFALLGLLAFGLRRRRGRTH